VEKSCLEELISDGLSIRQISAKLGKSPTTVRFWLDKYGLKTAPKSFRKKKWTDAQMMDAIKNSETISDVLLKVGLSIRPGNYDTVRSYVSRHNIDLSHMKGKSCGRGRRPPLPLESIFCVESKVHRGTAKRYLLKNGIVKNECCLCKQGPEWRGEPLVMVLDHINGISTDYRMENLRLLCPQCNSQQGTFCRRRK
jgi:hypothetical protein